MRTRITLAWLLIGGKALAQPQIEWQRNLGGSLDDTGASAEQTSDGGFIVCGTSYSINGDVTGNHGNGDIWLVKLDADGVIQWQRALGGSQPDIGRWAGELPGVGYVVLGSSRSNDGDVSGNHGVADIWLAKVDMTGELIWQRSYGGSLSDVPFGIKAIPGGGWIIAGESRSSDGDVTSNAGFTDYWVLKVDTDGDIEWERSYGGSGGDTAYAITLTSDGGYVLNGFSDSNDGDVSGAHGSGDYWVIKVDGAGNIQWQRPCGGSSTDYGFDVRELPNGNILAFGEAGSGDGDVVGANGSDDCWMIELSNAGVLVDNAAYGGSGTDRGRSAVDLVPNGFLYAGSSNSTDGDVAENSGSFDGWLFRTDADGMILWQVVLGGTQSDGFAGAIALGQSGFLLRGGSSSNDGDLPGNHGMNDIWIVRLGPDPVSVQEHSRQANFYLYPNPASTLIDLVIDTPAESATPWQIFDPAGRMMDTGKCGSSPCKINVSGLDSGSYTLLVGEMKTIRAVSFTKF